MHYSVSGLSCHCWLQAALGSLRWGMVTHQWYFKKRKNSAELLHKGVLLMSFYCFLWISNYGNRLVWWDPVMFCWFRKELPVEPWVNLKHTDHGGHCIFFLLAQNKVFATAIITFPGICLLVLEEGSAEDLEVLRGTQSAVVEECGMGQRKGTERVLSLGPCKSCLSSTPWGLQGPDPAVVLATCGPPLWWPRKVSCAGWEGGEKTASFNFQEL